MHEMGIALQVIEVATASIPPELKDVKVERIRLRIGKFSGVVADSLSFCFAVASRETPLEGAEVVIEEIPSIARCRNCGNQWEVDKTAFSCPECSSTALDMISGRELEVSSIEIAEPDPA